MEKKNVTGKFRNGLWDPEMLLQGTKAQGNLNIYGTLYFPKKMLSILIYNIFSVITKGKKCAQSFIFDKKKVILENVKFSLFN